MGMAASQARLLSLTSRMSDLERRSQGLTNSKVRLANESEAVSQTYTEALSKQKLQMNTYTGGTYQTVDVTADVLADNNYRLAMKNASGTTIPAINGDTMPEMTATFNYSGTPAVSGVYASAISIGKTTVFPAGYTKRTTAPTVTQPSYVSTQTTAPSMIKIEDLAQVSKTEDPALATKNLMNSLAKQEETWRAITGTHFYGDSGLVELVKSGSLELIQNERGFVGFKLNNAAAEMAKNQGLPTEYSSFLDLMTALLGADQGLEFYKVYNKGVYGTDSLTSTDYEQDLMNFNKDGSNELCNLRNADGKLGQMLGITITVGDKNFQAFCKEMQGARIPENDMLKAGSGVTYKGYVRDLTQDPNKTEGTNNYFVKQYIKSQQEYKDQVQAYTDYINYKSWMDYSVTCVFNEYNAFIVGEFAEQQQEYENWVNANAINPETGKPYSPAEIKEGLELYRNLQTKGAAYISAMLQYSQNSCVIQHFENDQWVNKTLAQTTMQLVHDESIDAVAEAKYNSSIAKIKVKENQIDRELKKIETEHSAAEAEYDSVKSIIEKNMETSMKLFA